MKQKHLTASEYREQASPPRHGSKRGTGNPYVGLACERCGERVKADAPARFHTELEDGRAVKVSATHLKCVDRVAAEPPVGKVKEERWERGLPRAADTGASSPALTPDEGQPETPQGVAWSHPSRGITGDLGGPLSERSSPQGTA